MTKFDYDHYLPIESIVTAAGLGNSESEITIIRVPSGRILTTPSPNDA